MGKEKKNVLNVLGTNIFKKHGVLDFNGLFTGIPQWLRLHSYDFFEKGRSEKVTSTGKYIESNWVAEREVTPYVKYKMKINILVRDLTDVAVEKHGKTIKMQRGRVEVDFKTEMEKNYMKDGRRRFNPEKEFQEILRVFYERYVAKQELSKQEDKLLLESQDFVKHIHQFLYP